MAETKTNDGCTFTNAEICECLREVINPSTVKCVKFGVFVAANQKHEDACKAILQFNRFLVSGAAYFTDECGARERQVVSKSVIMLCWILGEAAHCRGFDVLADGTVVVAESSAENYAYIETIAREIELGHIAVHLNSCNKARLRSLDDLQSQKK
ncbi:MAG: hypothetical protein RR415_12015 [Ruthenibacterium sp.]